MGRSCVSLLLNSTVPSPYPKAGPSPARMGDEISAEGLGLLALSAGCCLDQVHGEHPLGSSDLDDKTHPFALFCFLEVCNLARALRQDM